MGRKGFVRDRRQRLGGGLGRSCGVPEAGKPTMDALEDLVHLTSSGAVLRHGGRNDVRGIELHRVVDLETRSRALIGRVELIVNGSG